ncbi:MAG: hypothetical protein R2867_09785 [Caldilineaceae bacterium]
MIGFYTRWAEFSIPAGVDERGEGAVSCDVGDQAMGGGYWNPNAWADVILSAPDFGNPPTEWQVWAYNNIESGFSMRIWVICADLTP